MKTTPSTSAQGPVAPEELAKRIADAAADMCEIARIADEWRRGPKQSLTAIREIRAMLTASPSPAASPASPSGVREAAQKLVDRFPVDMPSHSPAADEVAALRRALASDVTPAPTSGSEDAGEIEEKYEQQNAAWSDFEAEHLTDGEGHATAEVYAACRQAFDKAWPLGWEKANAAAFAAYNVLAKPASEPAGGDVRETAERAWNSIADSFNQWSELGRDEKDDLVRFAAALSSSAAPAVEAVAWRWKQKGRTDRDAWVLSYHDDKDPGHFVTEPLYAHPAPATVDIEALTYRVANAKLGEGSSVRCEGPTDFEKDQARAWVKRVLAALAPATEGRKS